MASTSRIPNRLIREKSPYLLQHAYNPVDWYPWGPAAFEKSKKENKPLLVSIGYSTCHWCHVMERESFENPEIATVMNEYFVNIKVDREERPDVDKIYMTAVSAMTGSGGWPLNVFLTPELKPFFGGTYFPPTARGGHPGWIDVVRQIGQSWHDPAQHEKILSSGNQLTQSLENYVSRPPSSTPGDMRWLHNAFHELQSAYDATYGGFGPAPKFPMPVYHNFLLRYAQRTKDKQALDMSLHTLRQMGRGGIVDHLGGGFSRYSTDERWHVPHFEKMLYDNAQLMVNYLEAFQISKDSEFQRIAREGLDYLHRDMAHPEGGFYSAEDADSLPAEPAGPLEAVVPEKAEGAFYVWEKKDVLPLLTAEEAEVFCFHFGVRDEGNVLQDPHGEFLHKNVLYEAHPVAETAHQFKRSEDQTRELLDRARKKLWTARQKRPRPQRDDKIIAGWNGLAISAFAKAHNLLQDPRDLLAAQRTAQFLKTQMYDAGTKILFRRWCEGDRHILGISDDYVFVVQGLIDLYEADGNVDWLAWALELTESLNRRFFDARQGGYFMTASDQDPSLILRIKEDMDNVEPCASSVGALNLLRLADYFDREDFREMAQQTLEAFGSQMKTSPRGLPQMLVALEAALSDTKLLVIVGDLEKPDTRALLNVSRQQWLSVKALILAEGGERQAFFSQRLPFLATVQPFENKATAYLCEHHACQAPITDPDQLALQLQK